jgi:hypothetical protein
MGTATRILGGDQKPSPAETVTHAKLYLRLRERDLIRGGNSVLPLNFEQQAIEQDAKLFARWILQGAMTAEQAKADILPTPRQLAIACADHDAHILRDVLRRRQRTWEALKRLLDAEAKRSVGAMNQPTSNCPAADRARD